MFRLRSWTFLFLAGSLYQLSAAQTDTCYQLKPADQRTDLVCEKYGTLRNPAPLGAVTRKSVNACVKSCAEYPNGACKSIFYDYYTGCELESKPPAQMGYKKPSNPDEYSFISNIRCYQAYQSTAFVNGNFSQGQDPWLSYGPVTFNTGTARVSVPYNATYTSANQTNFQISQGLFKLCAGKSYDLNYTQHLERVKGSVEVRFVNQSKGQILSYFQYNISQPTQDAGFKPQSVYALQASGAQGDTYAVVLNGYITTTRLNPAKNPGTAVVEWDDFVLNPAQ